jgi:hypothetical protein
MIISVNTQKSCPVALSKLKSFSWSYEVVFSDKSDTHYDANLVDDELFLILPAGQKDVSFSWGHKMIKWSHDKSISNNLMRALKVKSGDSVIDATMGFGVDTSYLLFHGLKVLGFERHPLLHFLLQGSALLNSRPLSLSLIYGEAAHHIESALPVYFDPMFDGGNDRKAASKKEMTFLHQMIGASEDAFDQATKLRSLSSRLVIKRSPRMNELLPNRNSCWESKAVRFDLYL